MTDDRPTIKLGHGQVDIVARWALKDAIDTLELLRTRNFLEEYSQKNLDGLKVAYTYFGGDNE